jgi:aspartyl-tRNA(Asn)/glutamyl-tRNA(Gln) amidotransferase subunit A
LKQSNVCKFIASERLDALVDDAQKHALREYVSRPAASYPQAARERVDAVLQIRQLFSDVDALVAPTVLTEAVALEEDLLAYREEERGGNMYLGSIAGLPELTVPMGFDPTSMPVGLSIIGDILSDPVILAIGIRYQRMTDWHLRRPSL